MIAPLLLLCVTCGPPIASRLFDVPRWRSYPLEDEPELPIAGCEGARDLCPANARSSNPTGGAPIAGLATAPEYQWCYVVKDGDTAQSIAERVTGDRRRARELVAANPEKAAIMIDGVPEFAKMCARERLLIPKGDNGSGGWNEHFDQVGNPRGLVEPFPKGGA